jgi:hypothetical protein
MLEFIMTFDRLPGQQQVYKSNYNMNFDSIASANKA